MPEAALRRRAEQAACVIACNVDAHGEIARLGVSPRLVPHGVNLQRFAPAPRPDGAAFEVLGVGRLVQKKGFDVLLRALARATERWSVRFVGDGPDGPALKALAAELGVASRVIWHGGCSHADLPALYTSAHAVAVPSVVDDTGDRDGLPNVVLEALASGRPVVATPVGAIASAIVDGDTGRLVPAGDPSALALALDGLVRDIRRWPRRWPPRGRRLVEARYDGVACAAHFSNTLAEAYAV